MGWPGPSAWRAAVGEDTLGKFMGFISALLLASPALAWISAKVQFDANGRLTYPADGNGNRIPDFSHAGYKGGGVPLPTNIPVRVNVSPISGDDTANIQAAIDQVGNLAVQPDGYRGTVLLAAGTKGKRHALPNCRVMIHQPSGGATGQTSDISIAAKEILRWRDTLNHVLAKHSGKTPEELQRDSDRDFYMTAEEAIEYGLADAIVKKL